MVSGEMLLMEKKWGPPFLREDVMCLVQVTAHFLGPYPIQGWWRVPLLLSEVFRCLVS